MRKKKIVFHSNFCGSKTGFGRHSKAVLTYLYKTGKYDICEYGTGLLWDDPRKELVPWKCRGVMPNDQRELFYLRRPDGSTDETMKRLVDYGSHNIDRIIREEKPDIYIGVEDIWAFMGYWDRRWWNKINCIIHTTLDSIPIHPIAVDSASKIKNYYVWAKFAEDALHKLGHPHVKTIHGSIDTKHFRRLSVVDRARIREENNIPQNAFIIGFVFRNQLRKSVHKLIQAFADFSKRNPKVNGYLLLHTFWEEGWRIWDYLKEFNVPNEKVLTTYVCRHCHNYEVKPFTFRDVDCNRCGSKATPEVRDNPFFDRRRTGQVTTSTMYGVTEEQLNEVYNLMNVYVHPFTSGGQEIPVQEAKLTELITLVTDYSCGEEYSTPESGGIPLDWTEYREPESQFIKATTNPFSIVKGLEKVVNMSAEKRVEIGQKARKFVLDNCSVEVVGKQYEDFIDALPFIDWDFDFREPEKNTKYPIPDIADNLTWIKNLYSNILLMKDLPDDESGVKYWMGELGRGISRQQIYDYFIETARRENAKREDFSLEKLFDKDDREKRILYVMPESIGDCFLSTSLFKSIKDLHPDSHLYVATQPKYFQIFEGNPYVHKTIPFIQQMEDELAMTGQGSNKGIVQVLYTPHFSTQRQLNYLSKDKIAFNLKS